VRRCEPYVRHVRGKCPPAQVANVGIEVMVIYETIGVFIEGIGGMAGIGAGISGIGAGMAASVGLITHMYEMNLIRIRFGGDGS
jgi:hypothetical protein